MAWLGWIVVGILAWWMGFFSLIHQQQLDVLRRNFNQAAQEVVAQQKKDLGELENSQVQMETELTREKAKTLDARNEHDRARDEVDSLDNQVAEARRSLDTAGAEVAGQDPEMGRAVLIRDAKRLESDIRKLRNGLAAMTQGAMAGGGGVP
jgi:hypothetical protein